MIKFKMDLLDEYYRHSEVTYQNNLHENIIKSSNAINQIFANSLTNIFLKNNTYINVSGSDGMFTIISK